MKYTIEGYSQAELVRRGLTANDALFLRWFSDFRDSGRMARHVTRSGTTFYWLAYKTVGKELPILGWNTPRSVRAALGRLVKARVLRHRKCTRVSVTQRGGKTTVIYGTFAMFAFTPTYAELSSAPRVADPASSGCRRVGHQDDTPPVIGMSSKDSSSRDSSTKDSEEHTPSPTGRGEEIGAVYAQETGGKTLRMSAEEERGAAELVAAEGPEVATRAYRLFLIDRMRRGTAIRFAYFLENVEQYIGRATAEPTEIWNVCAVGHRHRGEECQYCRDYTIAPADLASADEMADAFRGLAWRGAR